jgi:molecular chaperone DnaK
MTTSPCFGIDLGTTASAIGWVHEGSPRLIPVGGSVLLPSVVSYRDDGVLVGIPARNALPLDPDRTITSSKRHMGTDHRYPVGARTVTPVDVAEQILRALADGAERAVGVRPERVVITVPAWFTQAQRADTKRAGEQAGLVVERILNEPTAAALAHAHGQEVRRRTLVYDLGGGTFDVSVVDQDGPLVEVLASHGDSLLGGDDIDLALVGLLLRRIGETDPELRAAVEGSTAAQVRLRLAAEAAKIELSESVETTVRVPFLLDLDGRARHVELALDRGQLDRLAAPFVERTLRSVDQVLADCNTSPAEVDELLLVGGSTLQPLVWHVLHERYGLEGSHAIAPREVVALGAAIQGAILDGSRTDGILIDVAPYSLSVGAATGPYPGLLTNYVCRVITPRNSPLPARHAELFSTVSPYQTAVEMYVFQGSSVNPRRNVVLGLVRIDDLPELPEDTHDRPIRVDFRHDVDGMVQIAITDTLTGTTATGQVAADGDQQAELRERLLASAATMGVVLGDGSEELPEEPAAAEGANGDPVDEARLLFADVLDAGERLASSHGSAAAELVALARAGADALAGARDADALATYDALSDRMFTLGIYL